MRKNDPIKENSKRQHVHFLFVIRKKETSCTYVMFVRRKKETPCKYVFFCQMKERDTMYIYNVYKRKTGRRNEEKRTY